MTFVILTKEDFIIHTAKANCLSFMQTPEMASLLQKRGAKVEYIGYTDEKGTIQVSALLYSLPMIGGLHMEINSGPVSTDSTYLQPFYKSLQDYAKKQGALELLVKPYEIYQTFDSNGKPISEEHPEMISTLTDLGYHFDGLNTGYPEGEPNWHYVKQLEGVTEETLLNSFSKKGKPLVKKANTFGIKIRSLTREELPLFKEITSATSERREYSDKSLDYYQHLYDSFGNQAEFMLASLNFQDYLNHITTGHRGLKEQIQKIENELIESPDSIKKKNKLQELLSQEQTFVTRQKEAQAFIQQYGEEDQILAGSLFIYTQQESTYLFSGSYPEFNKFYAPALLQEYAMKESIKRGIPSYNFLGITGLFDGSDGVLRFKQNFNGYIVRRIGTFRFYPKPVKVKLINLIKKIIGR